MTDTKWIPTSSLFDSDGKILSNGVRELIIWDKKNKRSRHGTHLTVLGNPERFTHFIDPRTLGEPQ